MQTAYTFNFVCFPMEDGSHTVGLTVDGGDPDTTHVPSEALEAVIEYAQRVLAGKVQTAGEPS